MIEKFTIPTLDKEDLLLRLEQARWPQELDDVQGWKCGAPSWAVKSMVDAWRHSYNWDRVLQEIESWQHYRADVQDLKIHFIHERSTAPNAIPIVLLHGWPSTFYEFHKMINILRDGDGNQSFHVVVPSLPGYGFSEAPKKDGSGSIENMAVMMHKLMVEELGYKKYMIYGTDWGASIGTLMAMNNADHVLGFLTTMPMASPPLPNIRNLVFNTFRVLVFLVSIFLGFELVYGKRSAPLTKFAFANCDKDEGAGYRAIQARRPYTQSYGLTDSPIGLLGWMLDPYHAWTNIIERDGNTVDAQALPHTVSTDEFLTQVTIYWLTNSMSSSMRLYYETIKPGAMKSNFTDSIVVPTAVSYFKNEVVQFPRDWLAISVNLVQYKTYEEGGHFPALEVPHLLIADIQEFGGSLNNNTVQKHNANAKKNN